MKTQNILCFILMVFLAGTSCQKKIDIEMEKEAIKAVIEEESNAFIARDYDRLAATYVQDETNIRMGASKTIYGYRVGWKEIDSVFKEYFKNNPKPSTRKPQLTNYKIKVYKESAWAFFTNEKGDIGVRFLEKFNGEWKIVFLSAIMASTYEEEIEDGEGELKTEESE